MGSLAEQVLAPALAAVADTQHLQGLGMMSSGQQQGSQQVQSVQQDDMLEGQQQQQQGEVAKQQEGQQQQEQASASSAAQLRPQALAASFYTECRELPLPPHPQHQQQQQQQHTQQQPGSPAGLSSSDWVLRCPKAPVAGFAGYTASITAAEALFRHHFPDVPWLTDPLPTVSSAAAAAGGEEGGQQGSEAATGQQDAITGAAGGAAAGGVSDDELDAIDELTAALMELSSGLDEAPGQGSNAATQM
jgi:hypothetical protein